MTSRQLIVSIYVIVLAGLGAWAGSVAVDTRWEYNKLKRAEAELQRRLGEARTKLEEQKKNLERLRNDPTYVERVLRARKHARPDEIIFSFEH